MCLECRVGVKGGAQRVVIVDLPIDGEDLMSVFANQRLRASV
jgi:hypothetical protein